MIKSLLLRINKCYNAFRINITVETCQKKERIDIKLLTVVVPCYNSQGYMRHCIESLLHGGDDVEIIIVNDGSSDRTAEIADDYHSRYPDIIRTIHQPNGGHGGAINTGIAAASARFFKVVDSDDWVDSDAYKAVLQALKWMPEDLDVFISNYVYEKTGKKHKKVIRYTGTLPQNQVFTWDEIGEFRKGHYMLMHSLIYRTGLLRECGLQLPRHTFYVDNLYAYIPMKHAKTMYYLDVNFYHYYIGREGQSVQEETMIKRIDQQLFVNRIMVSMLTLEDISEQRKREYMFNYLEIVTVVSSVLLLRSGTNEHLFKKRELWQFIREQNDELYYKLRRGFLGQVTNLPGRMGRSISISAYNISKKVVGFN